MLIIIFLIIIFIIGYKWGIFLAQVFSIGFLLFFLVAFFVCYFGYSSFYYRFKFVESSLSSASCSNNFLDDTVMSYRVSELNNELASLKYFNSTIFDIFIPDRVEELDYLVIKDTK
jgi:hypothetical protein